MKEKLSTSGKSPVKRESDIQQLQARLSKKLKMIFFIPLAALIAVSYYAYDMSARLSQLEVGDRVNFIERTLKDSHNISFAIQEYEKLAKEQKTPQLLVRLGGLYSQRAWLSNPTKEEDIKLAINTLHEGNALYQEKH